MFPPTLEKILKPFFFHLQNVVKKSKSAHLVLYWDWKTLKIEWSEYKMGKIVESSKSSFYMNSLLFSLALKMLNLWHALWRKRRGTPNRIRTGKLLLEKSRTDKMVFSHLQYRTETMGETAGHGTPCVSGVNNQQAKRGDVASLLTLLQLNPLQSSFVQPSRILSSEVRRRKLQENWILFPFHLVGRLSPMGKK